MITYREFDSAEYPYEAKDIGHSKDGQKTGQAENIMPLQGA